MPRECSSHNKHPLPTTQEKTLHMDITRWSTLKSESLCSFQSKMTGSKHLVKIRPGTNCGSDHELLVAKFRLKWKKVGKATRPFRHDLNQIPYDYIVEVMNRFKGLDLVDRMSKELWRKVHNIVQQAVSKIILKKNKFKKAKWLSKEAL